MSSTKPDAATPRIAGLAPRWAIVAFAVDVLFVLLFAFAGRQSHDSGPALVVIRIAWPFLAGLAVAWAVTIWRRWPAMRSWPAGVVVWLGTYVIGMVLRGLTGGGLAPAFLVVSLLFLGLTLMGWRGYVSAKIRYRSRRLAD
ncbi:peptidoglycan/LPS O-acetylase OafA/YrhL [Nocardioides luteus]|uniref:DUF3054 domain-containing protein n=1 Tax=Nocardioides luteus TaxID=1844 RepID=A0ABQ5T341_9ACTN|nr:DUF3054 domain-containing protein [Nocardioides luteus]MDR7313649.1 peptidoglycan/LPS O-acetylase OafA/YrhL [Nocardioides luteus]GGR64260.1 hypothetical protein GCM10010197_34700 [Nocardioides luteus]GLJ70504.1 hypothetical protein GCM10017579_45400 [Nocardioides luteus]